MPKTREIIYDSMLFNYETTSRTDFRDGEIKPVTKTEYKKKPCCLRIRPPPLKDIHSLTNWKKPIVPFNLRHKPKDTVQNNPWVPQQPYDKPKDLFRKEVQINRPRLVMTPAVSMDDLDDRNRELVIADVYTSAATRAARGVGAGAGAGRGACVYVRAPLSPQYAPANPITLPKLQPSYVSPEWRLQSASWDARQLRTYCVPTRHFWLSGTSKV